MNEQEMKELELRRQQMGRIPFCRDHCGKVLGVLCRECEIERLWGLLRRASTNLKRWHAIHAAHGSVLVFAGAMLRSDGGRLLDDIAKALKTAQASPQLR